jgi:hypothetical protein
LNAIAAKVIHHNDMIAAAQVAAGSVGADETGSSSNDFLHLSPSSINFEFDIRFPKH